MKYSIELWEEEIKTYTIIVEADTIDEAKRKAWEMKSEEHISYTDIGNGEIRYINPLLNN